MFCLRVRQRLGLAAVGFLSGHQEQDIGGQRQQAEDKVKTPNQQASIPALKAEQDSAHGRGKRQRRQENRCIVLPLLASPRQIGREQEQNAQCRRQIKYSPFRKKSVYL